MAHRVLTFSVVTAAVALCAAAACSRPLPSISPTANAVYAQLVDGGCLAATNGGPLAVQQEEGSDAAPAWFQCLWDGGSTTACGVPCNDEASALGR